MFEEHVEHARLPIPHGKAERAFCGAIGFIEGVRGVSRKVGSGVGGRESTVDDRGDSG
jgi:hypothetical protein